MLLGLDTTTDWIHLALVGEGRSWTRRIRTEPGRSHSQLLLPELDGLLERTGEVCTRAGSVEIALITYWRDWEAIRAFAGPEPEAAVLYPGDERYEIVPDRHVRHDEVLSAHWAE